MNMLKNTKQTLLAYNKAVPRYTSYPTAPHFKTGFTHDAMTSWLGTLQTGQNISLYVHIPFCPKLCWFCGCNTKITQRAAPVADYVDILLSEIDLATAACPPGLKVTHLHFGGGSPTILNAAQFTRIMDALRARFAFAPDAEIAIEVDPRNLSADLARAYAGAGINRASLGVQDFDDKVMQAINRPQPFDVVKTCTDTLRAHGIDAINIDLVYGLPHQTLGTMTKLVQQTLALAPARISLFGYAHVPWMKKHMRLIPAEALPDDDLRYDLFALAADTLEQGGYVPIGIDHFAKPDDTLTKAMQNGTMHRNFQGYTTDCADALLGFGVSAISRLPQGYVQNTIHGPQYRDRIAAGHLPVEKHRIFDGADKLRADIIERLICDMRIDLQAICAAHGVSTDILADDMARLAKLCDSGLVDVNGWQVEVHVRQMVRLACAAFDAYLKPPTSDAPRHVSAL